MICEAKSELNESNLRPKIGGDSSKPFEDYTSFRTILTTKMTIQPVSKEPNTRLEDVVELAPSTLQPHSDLKPLLNFPFKR
jgi:hypothetical protein